ncbi:MAG: proline racemase family protein [Fimbriimonadaceae bacterium]|nr:proline racemase family protein [Chthonomonadaceae bacterium]MCO5297700.1 proline racemase family protein [Fimbriimonadaceae bacterium]
MAEPTRVRVIDSHTGGEPTRVVLDGGPALAGSTMAERRTDFALRFDQFRSAIVNEPRGSDVLVGALLTPPEREGSDAGVVFFNNVGMLGMCGHGTIGVVETLRHLGRVREGTVRLDTPVGLVEATLRPDGAVAFDNVASYRTVKDVGVHLDGGEHVVGDVAYGGNWFFLASAGERPIALEHVGSLTAFTTRIRAALERAEITGEGGAEIDHVELYTESDTPGVDSRNFVLCPGMAYDRSPCGTGTSAKVACLAQDGKLAEGEVWRQESVTGSVFEAKVRRGPNGWLPTIAGRAWVTGESTLLLNPEDPLCWGLGAP